MGGPYAGSLMIAMEGPPFWLTALICVIVSMMLVLAIRFHGRVVNPGLADRIQLKGKLEKKSKSSEGATRTPSAKRPRRSLRSGYAFAHHVSVQLSFIGFFSLFFLVPSTIIMKANFEFIRRDLVGS